MNENPAPTQTAIPSQPPLPTRTPHSVVQDAPHNKLETAEGESYTMKCICNFSGDDGSTIYCEPCDTWQHIGCFYPENRDEVSREDFSHFCHDCKPRPLDRERAAQRVQRLQTTVVVPQEVLDKKLKKSGAKSHKKKVRPNELQINGTLPGPDHAVKNTSPSDAHLPAKKAKTSHKPSHSISSQAPKRSPSYGNAKAQTNGHPPSPATTPPDLPLDFEIHNYSANFLSLYNEDGVKIGKDNTFEQLQIPDAISHWLRDPERLKKETMQDFKDVFQRFPPGTDTKPRPVRIERKSYSPMPGAQLRLRYLVTTAAVDKDEPLMELNGHISFQADYCASSANMWEELSSPLPFVFFHPRLPLCIDTRKEGSEARYVRRSCRPNAQLDTYLRSGTEYHFWLVSDRHIAANDQITLPWDFRFPTKERARMLHLLGLGDEEMNGHDQPEMDEIEYQNISVWVHRILSEYGGCACELGNDCAFARFHRHYRGRVHARHAGKKKSRRPKGQNVSPTSTGQATNSRAPSEGRLDEVAEADARSTTSRSKPPSRDRTPLPQQVRQGSFDQLGILTEPTDRDKRKVAMVEDSFRRMEQQAPARKKKRVSDGTGQGGGSTKPKSSRTTADTTPNLSNGVHYMDAGTSRSKSGSPASAVSPSGHFPSRHSGRPAPVLSSPPSRSNYCDASVQTDPVEGEWFSEPHPSPRPRRRIISLSQRLLNSRHQHRLDDEERMRQQSTALATHVAMEVDSPVDQRSSTSSPVLTKDTISTVATSPGISSGDVAMADAPSTSPSSTAPGLVAGDADTSSATSPAKLKTPDLRVQMPPQPQYHNTVLTMAGATTPLSTSGSVLLQSPFSTSQPSPFGTPLVNGMQPSPIKKKLSLSDYRKSRMDKAAAGKPLQRAGLDEGKGSVLESITDSPTAEKATNNADASPETSTKELPGN